MRLANVDDQTEVYTPIDTDEYSDINDIQEIDNLISRGLSNLDWKKFLNFLIGQTFNNNQIIGSFIPENQLDKSTKPLIEFEPKDKYLEDSIQITNTALLNVDGVDPITKLVLNLIQEPRHSFPIINDTETFATFVKNTLKLFLQSYTKPLPFRNESIRMLEYHHTTQTKIINPRINGKSNDALEQTSFVHQPSLLPLIIDFFQQDRPRRKKQKLGDNRQIIQTCCCCMEPMALHTGGDLKPVSLSCNHQICTGCTLKMVTAAIQIPYQLVSCPLCRYPVSSELIKQYCGEEFEDYLVYDRYVVKGIGELIGLDDKCDNIMEAIRKAMEQQLFGACYSCKTKVMSVEKVCAGEMPNAANFICTDCSAPKKGSHFTVNCPHCGAYVDRIGGCAFMTCLCGGYFCILCGVKVERKQYYSHFLNNTFGTVCDGPDGINHLKKCSCKHCMQRDE